MRIGEKHYNKLLKYEDVFKKIEYFVDAGKIEESYEIANMRGNQVVRELTLYLLKEYTEVFRFEPLLRLNYVPENYLYEAVEEDLCIHVNDGIEEIRDWAFAFCQIKKLIISKNVKYIGEGALSLNAGEIEYQGTTKEFISKFLGKTKCFKRSCRQQTIICNDGELVIDK